VIKAVVIEDSRLARHGLIKMLSCHKNIQVLGDADNVDSGLVIIEKTKPDVLFLDIHMPGETGFDLLDKLTYSPKVIFTTAYNEHALRSFEYHVIDYLVKPICRSRLSDAISKIDTGAAIEDSHTMNEQSQANVLSCEKEVLEMNSKLFIKDGDDCHLVIVKDIEYFESCKNYTRLFFHGKSAFIKKPISNVLMRLPEDEFLQVNRQNIISLSKIVHIELSMSDGCDITLESGKILSVSRRNLSELKKRLSI
jgi:two-component system, LytTR family, response regulator